MRISKVFRTKTLCAFLSSTPTCRVPYHSLVLMEVKSEIANRNRLLSGQDRKISVHGKTIRAPKAQHFYHLLLQPTADRLRLVTQPHSWLLLAHSAKQPAMSPLTVYQSIIQPASQLISRSFSSQASRSASEFVDCSVKLSFNQADDVLASRRLCLLQLYQCLTRSINGQFTGIRFPASLTSTKLSSRLLHKVVLSSP